MNHEAWTCTRSFIETIVLFTSTILYNYFSVVDFNDDECVLDNCPEILFSSTHLQYGMVEVWCRTSTLVSTDQCKWRRQWQHNMTWIGTQFKHIYIYIIEGKSFLSWGGDCFGVVRPSGAFSSVCPSVTLFLSKRISYHIISYISFYRNMYLHMRTAHTRFRCTTLTWHRVMALCYC